MVEMEQITGKIFAYTKGETRCNISAIVCPSFLIMIDSGMDPVTTGILREKIESVTKKKVKYLILTHHHEDHVFGNQVFSDCTILSSQDTLNKMEYALKNSWTEYNINQKKKVDKHFERVWAELEFRLPNKTFEKRYEIVDGDFRVELIQVDGHAVGSLIVWIEEESTIITGDILFAQMFPFGGDLSANHYRWVEAYNSIIAKSPKRVIPGHGPIVDKNEVEVQRNYLEDLIDAIDSQVREGKSLDEVKRSGSLPRFPYDINEKWLESMISQIYRVVTTN